MNARLKPKLLDATLLSALAVVVVTSAHHIYRLGPEVILPAIIMVVLLTLFMRWFSRSGRRSALWAFTVMNALIFVWFGVVDGFLDHVLKAVGMENLSILPGGEAAVVDTFYALWSPAAGNLFYELTGVVTFVLGVVAVGLNHQLLRTALTPRAEDHLLEESPAVRVGR